MQSKTFICVRGKKRQESIGILLGEAALGAKHVSTSGRTAVQWFTFGIIMTLRRFRREATQTRIHGKDGRPWRRAGCRRRSTKGTTSTRRCDANASGKDINVAV